MVFTTAKADAFKPGDKVKLGNGTEGVVKEFITSPTGFFSYSVETTDGKLVTATAPAMLKCASATIPVTVGDRIFNCRVARTLSEQSRGLQGSDPLGPDDGMLFHFGHPRNATFHMAGVTFPIDIMFVEGGRVARVVRNASPGSKERWSYPRAEAVIEVAAGQAPSPGTRIAAASLPVDTHYKIEFPGEIEDESNVPPDERWKGRDTVDVSDPNANEMDNKYWKNNFGYDPIPSPDSIREPAFRPSAQLEDPTDLIVGLIEGMANESRPLDWHRDALNPNLAYAVVSTSDIAGWVSNLGLPSDEATDILDTLVSEEGMQTIGDGVVLSGLAEIANVAEDHLILWKQYKELKMSARKEKIRQLLRKASPRWSLEDSTELESRPLSPHQHPGQAALMLVREALGQFEIPSRVAVSYKGMNRTSGYGQHGMQDGVIHVAAEFSSLSGSKHYIEVPVVVQHNHMIFPEIFKDQGGRIQVMAQSAFDEILRHGQTYTKMQDRLNMYSPNIEPVNIESIPNVGGSMFSVEAADRSLDSAERDMSDYLSPGQSCKLADDTAVQFRGGSRIVYDAGTEVVIIKDMTGEGCEYLCELPDGRRATVHYDNLS